MQKFYELTIVILLIIFCHTPIPANDVDEPSATQLPYKKHNIGLTAGIAPDFGIAYRYWSLNSFGVEAFIFPFFTENRDVLFLGVAGLKSVYTNKYNNVFVYLRTSYSFTFSDGDNMQLRSTINQEKIYTIGSGIGTELLQYLSLKVGFHYGIEDRSRDEVDIDLHTEWSIDLMASIFYSFGDL